MARESVFGGGITISQEFDSGMFTSDAKVAAGQGNCVSIWNGTSVLTPQSSIKFSRKDRNQHGLGLELDILTDIRFDLEYSQDYGNSEITNRKRNTSIFNGVGIIKPAIRSRFQFFHKN